MLRSYFAVAIRSLLRSRGYSLINVAGLAVGIAFSILTLLYVRFEWSYDAFHEHADQIYLLHKAPAVSGSTPISGRLWVKTPWPLTAVLQAEVPEIQRVVKVYDRWDSGEGAVLRIGDSVVRGRMGLHAESGFFDVFSFPSTVGNARSSLQDPNTAVISQRMARACFGDGDPVGQVISVQAWGGFEDYTVAAVVVVPQSSSLRFDFVLPLREGTTNTQWGGSNYHTFIQLAEGTGRAELQQKLDAVTERHYDELGGQHWESGLCLRLQPLTGIHLNTAINFRLVATSDPAYSYVLGSMALAVLLIACVNFVNLSIGLSSTRSREVGARKVLGARRGQVARQFWGEAVLLCFFSLVLGVLLAELVLPVFNGLVSRDLSLEYGATWPLLVGLVLLVGAVSGGYPALVLSGFHPVDVLKGRQRIGGTNLFSRGLVVLQFALSILLIIATLVMSEQMSHLRAKNLGFVPEQVVVVDTYGLERRERARALEAYRQLAEQRGEVLQVSMGSRSFDRGDWGTGGTYQGRHISFDCFVVDYEFMETLGMELLEGREFSRDFAGDMKGSIIINEAMMKQLGWETGSGRELALEDAMYYAGRDNSYGNKSIIGVVRDFHYEPLRREIEEAVFTLQTGNGNLQYIFARIGSEDIPSTLQLLRGTWTEVGGNQPFLYSFLDEDVDRQYREDERWGAAVRYASLLAICIACLGALGLTSLAAVRRTKEMGIRKVLGASVPRLVSLLSREFALLAIIANALAWPVAHYALGRWLEGYATRVDVGVGAFVLAGALTLALVWASTGWRALKSALANPIDALRYE